MKNFASPNGNSKTDFYVYSTSIIALAAAASSTVNLQVEADANFVLTKINYFAALTALGAITESSRIIPLVTLQITDSGSGRNLFNSATPLPNIAGEGDSPFIMPVERLFRANSSIALTFTNFSAATGYQLYLSLIGYKIWGV